MTPQHRTLLSAMRLLKSQMRFYVYEKLSQRDADWTPLLTVEQDFITGAEREWEETLALWDLTRADHIVGLSFLFQQACKEARQEVSSTLRERVPEVEALLDEFVSGVVLHLGSN